MSTSKENGRIYQACGSGNRPWQWQQALEPCQKWNLQTSLTENVISWNLGQLHLSTVLPYIAQTMQKGAAIVLIIVQEVFIRRGTTVRVRRELRHMFQDYMIIVQEVFIRRGTTVRVRRELRHMFQDYIELHRPSSKGTKLLFQVIKAIINHTSRDTSALEHMSQGHAMWLQAKTHGNVHCQCLWMLLLLETVI